MKYVIMVHGEDGYSYRAHGSEYLEKEHYFPSYDEDDLDMWEAFRAWEESVNDQANKELHEIYGDEVYAFVEPLYSDMFKQMGLTILEECCYEG